MLPIIYFNLVPPGANKKRLKGEGRESADQTAISKHKEREKK